MTQAQLDCAVADATGESLRTVHRLGFSLADRCPGARGPLPGRRLPVLPPARPVPRPGRRRLAGPGRVPAGCDVYFEPDEHEVYAADPAVLAVPARAPDDASPRGGTDRPRSGQTFALVQTRPDVTNPAEAHVSAAQFRAASAPSHRGRPRRRRPPLQGPLAMITLTRRQARRLRGVFRRSVLGIAHRGPIPPLVLRAEGSQLRAQYRYAGLAVEHVEPARPGPAEAIALPLDALADLEGRDDSPVVLEAVAPDRTVVRWADRGIPQAREYAVPALETLAPFPEPPPVVVRGPARPARRPGRGGRHRRRRRHPLRPELPPAPGRGDDHESSPPTAASS